MKYSPFTPGPIDMSDSTGKEVYPEVGLNRDEARRVITSILQQYGATDIMVSANITPGIGSRVTLNAGIDQKDDLSARMRR